MAGERISDLGDENLIISLLWDDSRLKMGRCGTGVPQKGGIKILFLY
jgi:hypothetical protein